MTRKDYNLIAKRIRDLINRRVESGDFNALEALDLSAFVVNLSNDLKRDNQRFDKARFIEACKGDGNDFLS